MAAKGSLKGSCFSAGEGVADVRGDLAPAQWDRPWRPSDELTPMKEVMVDGYARLRLGRQVGQQECRTGQDNSRERNAGQRVAMDAGCVGQLLPTGHPLRRPGHLHKVTLLFSGSVVVITQRV